jgi:hypothetical protein
MRGNTERFALMVTFRESAYSDPKTEPVEHVGIDGYTRELLRFDTEQEAQEWADHFNQGYKSRPCTYSVQDLGGPEPLPQKGNTVPAIITKQAKDLAKGDLIVNLGLVDSITTIGVFVVAKVRGTEWSLADGTGDVVSRDMTWHCSEDLSIDISEGR